MFKIGDKIVYINDLSGYNRNSVLILHKKYTVLITLDTGTIRIKEHPGWTFLPSRFELLIKHRELKINKILNKIRCQKIKTQST